MAAIAPVNVVVPAAPSPDSPILVDANDPLVAATSWLPWDPAAAVGGIPRVSLKNSEALRAFAVRCRLDRSPASLAALAPVGMLTLRLSANAWSTVLTAIRDNGLVGAAVLDLTDLQRFITTRVPISIILAADVSPAPVLGMGSNAAQREVLARIRFLGLANIHALEIQTGALANSAPWSVICTLAGALGDVGTQASRLVETAPVHAVAEALRAHGTGGVTAAAMAFNLRSNILRATLPKFLRASNVTTEEQCEELGDAFVYKLSAADRRSIEQKRLDCMSRWYARRSCPCPCMPLLCMPKCASCFLSLIDGEPAVSPSGRPAGKPSQRATPRQLDARAGTLAGPV